MKIRHNSFCGFNLLFDGKSFKDPYTLWKEDYIAKLVAATSGEGDYKSRDWSLLFIVRQEDANKRGAL
jgi:hypothetical protein